MTISIITVLTANKLTGKSYSLRDGELQKDGVVNATGRAVGRPVDTAQDLAELLRTVTCDHRSVLIPGAFVGSEVGKHFDIVVKDELEELLGPDTTEAELRSGVWEVGERLVAARLKESIEPCALQLLDFDTPEGMPPELAELDIAGRLALLEKVVPGISTCERVECRSSSARVLKPGARPGRASHAWVRLSDPKLVEVLSAHVKVEAALHGFSFLSPKYSKDTGEVIDHARLTLFDLAVLIRGRIVFCSAPVISPAMARDGWTVADAGVEIVNPGGGSLDISGIKAPSQKRQEAYRQLTGKRLKIKVGKDGTSVSITSRGELTLATPIEAEEAPVATFGEAVKWLQGQPEGSKVRCQAPFRESASWAAFIKLDPAGQPFLFDSGTSTSYRLAKPVSREVPEAVTAALMVKYAELPTENMGMQRLVRAFDEVPLSSEVLPNPDLTQGDKIAVRQTVTAARVHRVMDLIGMKVRLNVMTGGIECRFGDRALEEDDASVGIEALVHACARCGMSAAGRVFDVVVLRAREKRYSPVGDWICSKPWDGRSRIQDLCDTLTMRSPELNDWRNVAVRRWLTQTVVAIRNWETDAPTDVGHVLVLQGSHQGEAKSRWIRALLPEPWVTIGVSLRLDTHERDSVARATRTPITELGEIDVSFKRSSVSSLKNFLTTPVDIYRPAYGRTEVPKPRCTSFVGTVNASGFLIDATGARRFWPLAVVACKHDHGIDMQQLWAEVWQLEEKNSVFWLIGREIEMHRQAVEGHMAASEARSILDDLKHRAKTFNVSEYVHASAKDLCEHYRVRHQMPIWRELNEGLEAAGYRRCTIQGKSGFYVPPYAKTLTEQQRRVVESGFRVVQGGKNEGENE